MSRPLIFLGTTNLDIVFYSKALPAVGQSRMGRVEEFGGGKGANQAVAAARLGCAPEFATLFGEDDVGDRLVKGLADFGIQIGKFGRKPEVSSGRALIFVDENGSNMIGIDAGANECFGPNDVARALAGVSDDAVVVVEMGLPVEACRAVFAAKGKRFLIFNPAPVRTPLTDEDCRSIDILTPNESEAEELTGITVNSVGQAFKAARELHRRGIAGVAITLGGDGVVYVDSHRRIHQEAFNVEVVDTTAAGDAFTGALAAALAQGMTVEHALRFAVATASLSVTRHGAQQSMPSGNDVRAFLDEKGTG